MKSVYVTVPNGNGWIHKSVHFATLKILSDRRYKVRHDCPTNRPYVDNLHACLNDFLDGGEDYWLSMDDDNPPKRNPLDLVALDLDLVGFPTPVWHSAKVGDTPYYFNALDKVADGWIPHKETEGLQEVDAIGSGCFLVSRRVCEALKDTQPFMRRWRRDGRVDTGCDYAFCERVQNAGFQIHAHYDYHCEHFCELPLIEVINAFRSEVNHHA